MLNLKEQAEKHRKKSRKTGLIFLNKKQKTGFRVKKEKTALKIMKATVLLIMTAKLNFNKKSDYGYYNKTIARLYI